MLKSSTFAIIWKLSLIGIIVLMITLYVKISRGNTTYHYVSIFGKMGNSMPDNNNESVLFIRQIKDEQPPKGSIFFLETSYMNASKGVHLNARQSCSIESTIRAHRNATVYLLILSSKDTDYYKVEKDSKLLNLIINLPNVNLRLINFQDFLQNTPLKRLNDRNVLKTSSYPTSHASDILRYATLYNYLGTYVDLDVIFLKPVNVSNYVALESVDSVGAGAINFNDDETGTEIARICAKEIGGHFNGKLWGANGPGVLTRVLKKRCKVGIASSMPKANCRGFHVLPPSSFYEISWKEYKMFFESQFLNEVVRRTKNSFGIHVWNKFSQTTQITVNDTSIPYLYFANKYCPLVYDAVDGDFNVLPII